MNDESASFKLTIIENGYLFQYSVSNWLSLLGYKFQFQSLTGFVEFKKTNELQFKEVSVPSLSLKSFISIIKEHLFEWEVIRFDFTTDNNRIIEFYSGDCYCSFFDKEELLRFIKWLFKDESKAYELYSMLLENIGGTINAVNGELLIESQCDNTEGLSIETKSPF